jgi:membrane glycosyltransferase
MALTHTIFLSRLFLLRRGGAWNSQTRISHAVSWAMAWAKLWPQTLAGIAILAIVAMKMPRDIGYAIMVGGGLAISAPLAVTTAAPSIGKLFERLGIGRIPEETEPPAALAPLRLPAIDACGAKKA